MKGNKLQGIVPAYLVAKAKQGTLTLIVDDNPNLCLSGPCNTDASTAGDRKSSLLIPIIVAVVGIIILVFAVLVIVLCIVKRKSPKGSVAYNAQSREAQVVVVTEHMRRSEVSVAEPVSGSSMPAKNERIQTKNRCFTASEVSTMTNNFSKVIGKGGFGTLYLGVEDGVRVAVKILSASSTQGYKEFKAEVMRI